MRLTVVLNYPKCYNEKNYSWGLKQFWRMRRYPWVRITPTEQMLKDRGIKVYDINEITKDTPKRYNTVGYVPQQIKMNKSNPNWHDTVLYTYLDKNSLLYGLSQAKVLTNTVQIQEAPGLPDSYDVEEFTPDVHDVVKSLLLSTHVLDAQQVKLPRRLFNPERPMFVFPRIYGITTQRIVRMFTTRLLQFLENRSDVELIKQRLLTENLMFCYPFERDEKQCHLRMTGDVVMTSAQPLNAIVPIGSDVFDRVRHLPELYPVMPTISFNEEQVYTKPRVLYPLKQNTVRRHPHTVFTVFDPYSVGNLYEEPMTDEQVHGRTLMKAFTVAASYAHTLYQDTDIDGMLPQPVTVQCIQTDGGSYHFGVLQLNTLNMTHPTLRNFWYQTDMMFLYETCDYKDGRATLEGYNPVLPEYINTFYQRT